MAIKLTWADITLPGLAWVVVPSWPIKWRGNITEFLVLKKSGFGSGLSAADKNNMSLTKNTSVNKHSIGDIVVHPDIEQSCILVVEPAENMTCVHVNVSSDTRGVGSTSFKASIFSGIFRLWHSPYASIIGIELPLSSTIWETERKLKNKSFHAQFSIEISSKSHIK